MNQAPASDSGKRRSHPWLFGLLFNFVVPVALVMLGVGIFFLIGESEARQRTPDDMTRAGRLKRLPQAEVARVRSLESFGGQLNLSVDGVVVPYREVQVATEVSGQIVFKSSVCEAGNFVEEGTLLCRIDPQDYELEVERLTRMREQAYQQLVELDQELSNAKRLLEIAEQDLELRRGELKRLTSLPGGFASEGELDQARRAELQAMQAKVSSQNRIELLEKTRSRLETSERLAATQLQVAELNLDRTEIVAPVSGVIVREDAELNSFVQRGSPIFTIEDTSKAEVAVSLRMDQLHWILDQAGTPRDPSESGQTGLDARGYRLPETPATIEYAVAGRAGEVYRWEGRLLRYDGIGLDRETRTIPVRVVVDDPTRVDRASPAEQDRHGPSALVRGMFVQVRLHLRPQTELVVLPAMALKPGNRVWQFTPNNAVLAPSSSDQKGAEEAGPMANASDAAIELAGTDRFDPDAWVPGEVRALEAVRPIEAVPRPDSQEDDAGAPLTDSRTTDAETYWICEVAGGQLHAGGYVVTTPLSTVVSGSKTAVRVPTEQVQQPLLEPTASSVPAAPSVSAVPSVSAGPATAAVDR